MTEERKQGVSLNFETIGSVVAMLIGATALFVAWDQAQVMRKQQHASVWPLLNSDFTINPPREGLSIELQVAGSGCSF